MSAIETDYRYTTRHDEVSTMTSAPQANAVSGSKFFPLHRMGQMGKIGAELLAKAALCALTIAGIAGLTAALFGS